MSTDLTPTPAPTAAPVRNPQLIELDLVNISAKERSVAIQIIAADPEFEPYLKVARAILVGAYCSDVTTIAESIKDAAKSGQLVTRADYERFLDESVDGSNRVTETIRAREGLLLSDNADAAEQAGVITPDPSRAMYYALRADVVEELASDGVDVSEHPDAWFAEEDKEKERVDEDDLDPDNDLDDDDDDDDDDDESDDDEDELDSDIFEDADDDEDDDADDDAEDEDEAGKD